MTQSELIQPKCPKCGFLLRKITYTYGYEESLDNLGGGYQLYCDKCKFEVKEKFNLTKDDNL